MKTILWLRAAVAQTEMVHSRPTSKEKKFVFASKDNVLYYIHQIYNNLYIYLYLNISFYPKKQYNVHNFSQTNVQCAFISVGQILYSIAAAITASSRAVVVMDCRKAFIDRATHQHTHTYTHTLTYAAPRRGQTS